MGFSLSNLLGAGVKTLAGGLVGGPVGAAAGLGMGLAGMAGQPARKTTAAQGLMGFASASGFGGMAQQVLGAVGGGKGGGTYQWANGRGYTERIGGRTMCYVLRRDGTYKGYRPYRSIVMGKRIKAGQIRRATRRLRHLAHDLSPYLPKHRITRRHN